MFFRPVSLALPIALVACAGPSASAPPPVPTRSDNTASSPAPTLASTSPAASGSGIRFFVDPPDAVVQVNGRELGTVTALGQDGAVRLAPGIYRVTLRRDGFEPWRAEVAVRGGFERLQVQLVKRSP